jgi:DNA-binding MarR family transcriptional regulator
MTNESEIAGLILDLIPATMRVIRREVRQGANFTLTVPQHRVLAHLFRGVADATSLAELQGVTLPGISKMVDVLVERGLVRREPSKTDRRQAKLILTDEGKKIYEHSRKTAQAKLNEMIVLLTSDRKRALMAGLLVLKELFPPEKDWPPVP